MHVAMVTVLWTLDKELREHPILTVNNVTNEGIS